VEASPQKQAGQTTVLTGCRKITKKLLQCRSHPQRPFVYRAAFSEGEGRQSGTNRPFAGAAIAHAENPHFCSIPVAAMQLVSAKRSLKSAAIGILDAHIGDADPSVRRVLPDLEPLVFPVWLVAHRELRTNRRIRMVLIFWRWNCEGSSAIFHHTA